MTSGYFELKNEIAALKARRSREKEAMQQYLLKIMERNKRVEEFAFSVSQKIDNMDRKADKMLIELEALRLPHTSSDVFTSSPQCATESYSRLDKENEFVPRYSKYPDFPYEPPKSRFSSDGMYGSYFFMPATTGISGYDDSQILSPYQRQHLSEKIVFPTSELEKLQQMGQSSEQETLSFRHSHATSVPGLSVGMLPQQEKIANTSTLRDFPDSRKSFHTEMPYGHNNPQITNESKVVEPSVSSEKQYFEEKGPASSFTYRESQRLDDLSHNIQETCASKSTDMFGKLSSTIEPVVQAKKAVFVGKGSNLMTEMDKNIDDASSHMISRNSVDISVAQEQEHVPQILDNEETTKQVRNSVVEMSLSQHPNKHDGNNAQFELESKSQDRENDSKSDLQLNVQEASYSEGIKMNENDGIASDTSLSSREKSEIILQNEDGDKELVLQQINETESNSVLQTQKDGKELDSVQLSEKADQAILPIEKESSEFSSQLKSAKTDNIVSKLSNQNDNMVLQLQKDGKEKDNVQISETKLKVVSSNQEEKKKKKAKSSSEQNSKEIDNVLMKHSQNDNDGVRLSHESGDIEDRSFIDSPVGDKVGKGVSKASIRTNPESGSEIGNKITENSAKISAAKDEILMDKKGKPKARRKSKTRKRNASKKNILLEESSETDENFFERGLSLTSSAAYQSLIGAAPITPKAPSHEVISESESEDDVEKALAMAIRKGSSATHIENSPKKTQPSTEKPAVPEPKPASAQQRKTSLLPTSSAKMKLSKASRMALGLDSESDVPPIQPTIKKNVEEESDEFDFFN